MNTEQELRLHGPFKTDDFASYIYGSNDKIGGDNPVLEIRGWGYLTGNGHGALGLSHAEAVAEQKRFASFVVDALNAASPPAVAAGGVTAQNAQAALHLLRMMDDEIRRIPDKPDPVVKNNIGYYAQQLRAALAVGDEGIREDDTIRVCPERDARCPHGMSCPYNHDRYRCDMIGSRAALKDTTHAE